MSKVIGIIAIALLGYYWAHTQKLKTLAIQAGRKRCQQAGVQMLDQTVVQNKISLVKDSAGRWRLQRQYLFEFTSTGEQRYQGEVLIQNAHVVSIELEAYSIN